MESHESDDLLQYATINIQTSKPKERGHFITPAEHLAKIADREKTKHHQQLIANTNILGFRPGPHVVSVLKIGPEKLIENRAAWVEFEVWNRIGQTLENAFVRIKVDARQSINSYPGSFEYRISSLAVGESIRGAISFTLPRADYDNILTVELCQTGEVLAEFSSIDVLTKDEFYFDVAARFSVEIGGIWIRETASRHEDTVVVSLNAVSETGEFWEDSVHLGDHNNTEAYALIPQAMLPIGPIDLIPNSGKYISVNCAIANAGHSSEEEDAKKALKVVSTVGAQVATVVMTAIFPVGAPLWAGLSAGADQLHQAIIDWALADCDTVVLADGTGISAEEFFIVTSDPNDNKVVGTSKSFFFEKLKKKGEKISDFLGEGCRDSHYSTFLNVRRHRLPEVFHDYSGDGITLAPDQVVSFRQVFAGDPVIQYEVENDGRTDPNGNYKSPSKSTDQKFDIIKWKVIGDNKRGPFTLAEDFALVILT